MPSVDAILLGAVNNNIPISYANGHKVELHTLSNNCKCTGFAAPPDGLPGLPAFDWIGKLTMSVENVGNLDITLQNNDGGSSVSNRFLFGKNIKLAPNTSVEFTWVGYWKLKQ